MGRYIVFQVFAILVVAQCAFAQLSQTENSTIGNDVREDLEGKTTTESEAVKRYSHPIEMFKGWTMLYKGYGRSPILFNQIDGGRDRKYPELAFRKDDPVSSENSLKVLNLGVDDELSKATMAVYQPLHQMADEFSMDKRATDQHFALFNTIRGIAVLTLSYLDKTVAAGLATTQQQVDEHVTQSLLKQIAWTSSRLANPNKSQLYVDTDEKVEACMFTEGHPTALDARY